MSDVLLVSMPFGPLFSPSLGLSLLKAALAKRGIGAEVRYFSLDFAEKIGQAFYCDVGTEGRPPLSMLAGEWIFSGSLFGTEEDARHSYVEEILGRPGAAATRGSAQPVSPSRIRRVLEARAAAPAFLSQSLAEILERRPRLLGFTSTFQQHLASLSLARLVKAALPETIIVFGGANCEGIMGAETVRQFPFVDAVVSGEGEEVLPELATRVLEGRDLSRLEGVRTPSGVGSEFKEGRFPNARAAGSMDDVPRPDFGDFFQQFSKSRFSREWEASLFYETSRGCWWGERHHCTFCGLNGSTMAFRSKSPDRAVADLETLVSEHPGCDIQVVDNILDMAYFKTFLPTLAERKLGVDLFYETKANLNKEQIRLLRQAGVRGIQPGVESLSDSVLKLMRKGVSALQNVQLLKWCKELGVEPHWNFLWGFPGEDPSEYSSMASLVPLLTHLPAPVGFSDIRLDRFSPNFFEGERLGFTNIRPLPSYRHVYPGLSDEARGNLAYFFGFEYQEPRDVSSYVFRLVKELRGWMKTAKRGECDLFAADVDSHLVVWDLRPARRETLSILKGLERRVLLGCDAATDPRTLSAQLSQGDDSMTPPAEIEVCLNGLVGRGFAVRLGTRYLALPVVLGDYVPGTAALERFHRIVRGMAEPAGRSRRGLPPPRTLKASDFELDRRDLVVRGEFRISLDSRGRSLGPGHSQSLGLREDAL